MANSRYNQGLYPSEYEWGKPYRLCTRPRVRRTFGLPCALCLSRARFPAKLRAISAAGRRNCIRRHSGAPQRGELRCAIAHLRISRFRVRCYAPPRNDGANSCLKCESPQALATIVPSRRAPRAPAPSSSARDCRRASGGPRRYRRDNRPLQRRA
ncbi:hypothetical protein FFI89_016880 [Bradyrhizobium sp. KBS0727]|nr:hypothetical protein FFI71_016875 [Bradyrhizobium sp. KBS0725]QDW45278.1 hypothetical protein FFI89_016880 [Bradyrhizobium sp. KBS0727]